MYSINDKNSWQQYQHRLQRETALRQLKSVSIRFAPILPVLLILLYALVAGFSGTACKHQSPTGTTEQASGEKNDESSPHLSKKDLSLVLDTDDLLNLKEKSFDVVVNGEKWHTVTSLDQDLQVYLLDQIDRRYSQYVAIVAMDAKSGRIISKVGFDKKNPGNDPTVRHLFPAASVFKIVTAAAAIETCGLKPKSTLYFNGRKHTLYKNQLKEKRHKYTNRITFEDSFAQSVNPIFGKLGANSLKKETLQNYAQKFGFNRQFNFETDLQPSTCSIPEKKYRLAELASGFNRNTIMAPIHGALMCAAILNKGVLVEPTIIEKIDNPQGEVLYESRIQPLNTVVKPKTCLAIKQLMHSTITSGTARKSFRGYRRDKVLSQLNIGGKTGSIYNKAHNIKYDLFVGFAEEKHGEKKIAVSVAVGHGKYIGRRASYYARLAIKEFFKNYFAEIKDKRQKLEAQHAAQSKLKKKPDESVAAKS